MPDRKRLLILGGTTEARELAGLAVNALSDQVDVISSLAGRVTPVQPLPGTTRVGGFGGIPGLIDYLRRERIDWVIDATHPFAATMSAHAFAACQETQVPRLMLIRPPWTPPADTRCLEVENLAEAAQVLPRFARRAFLTIGASGLEAFADVTGVWFLVRLIELPEGALPLKNYAVVTGRPPYALDAERTLIQEHRIDTLVAKQSGGAATEAKLTAAREAGLFVVLIRRPPREPGEAVATAEEALAWLQGRL